MGMGASLFLPWGCRPAAAKLVGPDGVLHRVEAPAPAVEFMMEFPGHVVARADEVKRTRRAVRMQADEELRPGAVYLLLPMARVGSRLSDRQMKALLDAIRGRRRREMMEEGCAGGRRLFPEVAGGEEGKMAGLVCQVTGFPGKRLDRCRQWRPALDTIHESKSN